MTDAVEKVLIGVATFLVGALISHIWARYRDRVTTLSWTSSWSRLAFAADSSRYGRLEVRYNDVSVSAVYWVQLDLINESTNDLTELVVVIGFQRGASVLIAEGGLSTSLIALPIEQKFIDDYRKLSERNASPEALAFFYEHRKFALSVLNRGATAHFSFLLAPPPGEEPRVSLSCDHKGVVARNRPPREQLLGVDKAHATWVGLLVSALLVGVAAWSLTPQWWAIVLAWIVGLFGQLWGVLGIRAWKALGRVLS